MVSQMQKEDLLVWVEICTIYQYLHQCKALEILLQLCFHHFMVKLYCFFQRDEDSLVLVCSMLFLDASCLLPLHGILPNCWQKEVPQHYLQKWGSVAIGLLSDNFISAGLWQEDMFQICVDVNVGQ